MDPYWPHQHQINPPYPYPIQTVPGEGSNPLQQQLRIFWENQRQETNQAVDFRNHTLPLARIKKIMKSDGDVRMISADAPVVLAKACEMFILDLTLRSWSCTEESKRRTLQKGDIAAALSTTDLFDFLVDIVPRENPSVASVMMTMPSGQRQGCYGVGEGAGLNMGAQLPPLPDDHVQMDQGLGYDSGGGYVQDGGTWPLLSHDLTGWPPMSRE